MPHKKLPQRDGRDADGNGDEDLEGAVHAAIAPCNAAEIFAAPSVNCCDIR